MRWFVYGWFAIWSLVVLASRADAGLVAGEGQYVVWYVASCSYITAGGGGAQCSIAGLSGPEFGSSQAAVEAAAQQYPGSYNGGSGTCTQGTIQYDPVITNQPGTTDAQRAVFAYYAGAVLCNSSTVTVWAYQKLSGTDPNPAFSCAAWEGKTFGSYEALPTMCFDVNGTNGCTATRGSVGTRVPFDAPQTTWWYTVEAGAQECGSGVQAPEPGDPNCVTWEGVTHCADDETPEEFSTNGNAWSPDDIPPNGCVSLADGSVVCAGGAPTPPRPDVGTPGLPAQETANYYSGGNTYNWFNTSVVNNSTGNPPGGIQDGTGEYGGGCDPSVGDLCGPFGWTAPEDSNPYGELLGSDEVADAKSIWTGPDVPGLPNLQLSPSGGCPFGPQALPGGGSLDLSSVCTWYESWRGVFEWIVWLITIFILMSLFLEMNKGLP